MQAKFVHSLLGRELNATWKSEGFSRVAKSQSTWFKEGAHEYQFCRIFLDRKFGYMKPVGGRMFLRAWCGEYLIAEPQTSAPLTLGRLLPAPFQPRMQHAQEIVAQKILAGDWSHLGQLKETYSELFDVQSAWSDGMGYIDEDDLTAWTALLRECIPFIASTLPLQEADGVAG